MLFTYGKYVIRTLCLTNVYLTCYDLSPFVGKNVSKHSSRRPAYRDSIVSSRQEAIQIFREVINNLSSTNRDLKVALIRCQHACALVGWNDARQWFASELGGYPLDAELPDYRIVIGSIIWRTQVNSTDDRVEGAVEDFYGMSPDPDGEQTELNAWYDIGSLIRFSRSGAQQVTGETQNASGGHHDGLLERICVFDAAGFVSVLNEIQRITFNFASESYLLLTETGGTASRQPLRDPEQLVA